MDEILLASGTISAIIGLSAGFVGAWLMHKRLDGEVEAEIVGLRQSFNRHLAGESSIKGSSASVEARERRDEAMVKVMLSIKQGKKPMEAVKEVAGEYPDVAMWLAKKGLGL